MHYKIDNIGKAWGDYQEDKGKLHWDRECHYDRTKYDKRRTKKQTKEDIHALLSGIDIRCHSCDEGMASNAVYLRIGQWIDMLEEVTSKGSSEA